MKREEKGKSEVGVGGWARDIVVGWPAVGTMGQGNAATAVCNTKRAARKGPQPRTGPWILALSAELGSAASIGDSGVSCQGEGYNEECRHRPQTARTGQRRRAGVDSLEGSGPGGGTSYPCPSRSWPVCTHPPSLGPLRSTCTHCQAQQVGWGGQEIYLTVFLSGKEHCSIPRTQEAATGKYQQYTPLAPPLLQAPRPVCAFPRRSRLHLAFDSSRRGFILASRMHVLGIQLHTDVKERQASYTIGSPGGSPCRGSGRGRRTSCVANWALPTAVKRSTTAQISGTLKPPRPIDPGHRLSASRDFGGGVKNNSRSLRPMGLPM